MDVALIFFYKNSEGCSVAPWCYKAGVQNETSITDLIMCQFLWKTIILKAKIKQNSINLVVLLD